MSFKLLKKTFSEYYKNRVLSLSAALSYYAVISIAPFFILLTVALSLFLDQNFIVVQLSQNLKQYFGEETGRLLSSIIVNANASQKGAVSATSVVLTIIGVTAFFSHLQKSLNIIWNVNSRKYETKRKKVKKFISNRIKTFLVVLLLAVILLLSMLLSVVISLFRDIDLIPYVDLNKMIFQSTNLGIFLILMAVLFAYIFKKLPDKKIKFSEVFPGALITSTMLTLGQAFISVYFSYSSIGSTFGIMGSLLVLLVWLYYSSAVFFLGAEFTHVYLKLYKHKRIR